MNTQQINYQRLFEMCRNKGVGMQALQEVGFSKTFVAQKAGQDLAESLVTNDWF